MRDGVELLSRLVVPGTRFLDGENVGFALGSDFEYRLVGLGSPGSVVLDECDFPPLLVGNPVQDVAGVGCDCDCDSF